MWSLISCSPAGNGRWGLIQYLWFVWTQCLAVYKETFSTVVLAIGWVAHSPGSCNYSMIHSLIGSSTESIETEDKVKLINKGNKHESSEMIMIGSKEKGIGGDMKIRGE